MVNSGSSQCCAGNGTHWLPGPCHISSQLCVLTSHLSLESGHGGSIDTTETGKYYKSSHSTTPTQLLNIYQNTTGERAPQFSVSYPNFAPHLQIILCMVIGMSSQIYFGHILAYTRNILNVIHTFIFPFVTSHNTILTLDFSVKKNASEIILQWCQQHFLIQFFRPAKESILWMDHNFYLTQHMSMQIVL